MRPTGTATALDLEHLILSLGPWTTVLGTLSRLALRAKPRVEPGAKPLTKKPERRLEHTAAKSARQLSQQALPHQLELRATLDLGLLSWAPWK